MSGYPPRLGMRLARGIALTALACGTASCGHSPPTRFFTLDPVAPAALPKPAYRGPAVRLTSIRLPPQLDRAELVREVAAGEVEVHDFEHWSAPVGRLAEQSLLQDLVARLPAGRVLAADTPSQPEDVLLQVDVISIQFAPNFATMQAGWSLSAPGPNPAAPRRIWTAPISDLSVPEAGQDGVATAAAFSALLSQLSDRISLQLSGVSAPPSEPAH